jgi:hypothetical protein
VAALAGLRAPVFWVLLAIAFFTSISGKPVDGVLMLIVAVGLAWDAGRRALRHPETDTATVRTARLPRSRRRFVMIALLAGAAVYAALWGPHDAPRRGSRQGAYRLHLVPAGTCLLRGVLLCRYEQRHDRYDIFAAGLAAVLEGLSLADDPCRLGGGSCRRLLPVAHFPAHLRAGPFQFPARLRPGPGPARPPAD